MRNPADVVDRKIQSFERKAKNPLNWMRWAGGLALVAVGTCWGIQNLGGGDEEARRPEPPRAESTQEGTEPEAREEDTQTDQDTAEPAEDTAPAPEPEHVEDVQEHIKGLLIGAGLESPSFDTSGFSNVSDGEAAKSAISSQVEQFQAERTDDELGLVNVACWQFVEAVDSDTADGVATPEHVADLEASLAGLQDSERAGKVCRKLFMLAVDARSPESTTIHSLEPCPGVDFLWVHNKPEECE